MKFNPWQIIVSTFLTVATILSVAIYLTVKGLMPSSILVGAISSIVVAGGLLVVRKFEKAAAEKDTELQVEKARSEMPPALKDATIVVTRPRMPSVADLSEVPAEVQAPTNTTNVSVEVKS